MLALTTYSKRGAPFYNAVASTIQRIDSLLASWAAARGASRSCICSGSRCRAGGFATSSLNSGHTYSSTLSRPSMCCCIGINFRAAGYADLGTLYTSAPFPHTPTCMRPVHFEASLWIALVRNTSMRPGNNGPLRIRPMQLGTEQQGRLSLHPASLPRTLRRFAFALWPRH